jgi:hypothetical protein
MKRNFWSIILALILSVFICAPVFAVEQDMWAAVYKDTGKLGADGKTILERIESGITFKVLAVDSDTAETLTYYGKSTSLTNPVSKTNFASATICNKMVAFRVDPTDATNDRYVDLIVTDTNGAFTRFVENFDQYTHAIVIDERPNVMMHGMYPFAAIATESNYYTGVTFLADTIIHDVRVEMVTVSTGTMSVGLFTSTATAFINGVNMAVAGYIPDTAFTSGTASTLYGPELVQAPHSAGTRLLFRNGYVVAGSSANVLSYTQHTANGTGVGYIHYWFTRMR